MDQKQFDLVLTRLDNFFNNVINKNDRESKNHRENETIMDIALRSVQYALAPSVGHACRYYGRNDYAHTCFKSVVKPFLARYIADAYNSGCFDMDDIYQKMIEIKNYYHAPEYLIEDYTDGNAQKLVSIAFKMFFVLLHYYGIRPITINDDFMGYNYCIIDSIILKTFKKNRFTNLSLIETWSSCDDLNLFKETQRQLQSTIHDEYYNNVFYEILSWKKEEDTSNSHTNRNTKRNTTRSYNRRGTKYSRMLSDYVKKITKVINDKEYDRNTFEACHYFTYDLGNIILPMKDVLKPLKGRVSPYVKNLISINEELLKIFGIIASYVLRHSGWEEYIPEGFSEDQLETYFGDKVDGEYNYKAVVEYAKKQIKEIINK